jgi:NADP-dependent 3-hydroxy acid dehydrogenase YdfG
MRNNVERLGEHVSAPGSVDAMSAYVAIVAGAGGALGHATAAALAASGLSWLPFGRLCGR